MTRTLLAAVFLSLVVCTVQAGRFNDTFSTHPATAERVPFIWDSFLAGRPDARVWKTADGVLEYDARNAKGSGANVSFAAAGIQITDETAWSMEVGFRHIVGTAPKPEYETLIYVTWFTQEPKQMRIVAAMYDAAGKKLVLVNGQTHEPPIPVDLSGDFHAVRMTVSDAKVRLYVDEVLKGGPYPLRARTYTQTPGIWIGCITSGEPHTLRYQFDYLAFTDEGAFAPGEGDWTPAADTRPVAEGLKVMKTVFEQPPYPNIKVLSKQQGSDAWEAAIPECWKRLRALIATQPRQLELPFYHYEGESGPSKQNIYRNYQALIYDDRRCVAISHLTRGIDDTAQGFMDYKLWYRISTDDGNTWDEERPMLQQGDEFTPMHPNKFVWIGKNSFCYASVPPFLKMSNGQILLPFYYAPLDENGEYYNPVNAFTFTSVACMIGTWNEAGDDIIWDVSQDIRLPGELSSRGANECAVIELSTPGHILMVTRGSNQPFTGTQKAWKWKTLSTDYGKTWSEYTQFTFDDGESFLSPSSMSNFIRSSKTGKVYWLGNISRTPPKGNHPRYPLVIAELDEQKLALRKETVTIIDDRGPEDAPEMQLSNFSNVEEPQTGNIMVTLNRYDGNPGGRHTYVIEVK